MLVADTDCCLPMPMDPVVHRHGIFAVHLAAKNENCISWPSLQLGVAMWLCSGPWECEEFESLTSISGLWRASQTLPSSFASLAGWHLGVMENHLGHAVKGNTLRGHSNKLEQALPMTLWGCHPALYCLCPNCLPRTELLCLIRACYFGSPL